MVRTQSPIQPCHTVREAQSVEESYGYSFSYSIILSSVACEICMKAPSHTHMTALELVLLCGSQAASA